MSRFSISRFNQSGRVVALCVAVAAASTGALAQVSSVGFTQTYKGSSGANVLAGTNMSASGTIGNGTFTTRFTGDQITSLVGSQAPGTYSGLSYQIAIIPFTVGALPVRIGSASLHANFKLVASGGNGIAGGNDPVVNLNVLSRLYQQSGATPAPATDAWLSAIEFGKSWSQNGNGLQVIDKTFGPEVSNYILTPGDYYIYQLLNVSSSFTSNGGVQPLRGATVEYGGDLTGSTYSGFTYSFDWQTVPTPGSAALLGVAGLVAIRRRR